MTPDLVILGAGVCGVSAAHEACRRGLHVLLVDRGDIGGGASSNSMRIGHGGLRYLQHLDLRRSFESVRERRRLLRMAPHCVRPIPFRMDPRGRSAAYLGLVRLGLLANDLLSPHRNRGVRSDRRLPGARHPIWYDAYIEDTERLMLDCLHTAVARGPGSLEVRTHAQGAALDARAACRLRCVGAHREGPAVVSMNLVLGRLSGFPEGGVAIRHPDDGRNVFVVSVGDRSVVGTYDRAYEGEPQQRLELRDAWIGEVIAWLRPVHASLAALSRRDVRRVHAGIVPGEPGGAVRPSERSQVRLAADGDVWVEPVKWTTAYGVAAQAVDRALARLGRSAPRPEQAPLLDGRELRAAASAGDPALREPVAPGCAITRGDLRFAVEREWAKHLDDVLLRRTGLAAHGHPGRALADAVAEHLQRELDWSQRERDAELEAFHADPIFAGNVPA